MNDRLLLAGSDDVLLHYASSRLAQQLGTQALVGYTPCGTRQGLAMLARGHVDLCAIHWARPRRPTCATRRWYSSIRATGNG